MRSSVSPTEPRFDSSHAMILADLATRLLTADRTAEIVNEIFNAISTQLQIDMTICYLADADATHLRLESCEGVPAVLAAGLKCVPFGRGVCGTAAARRQPMVVENVQSSADPLVACLQPFGVRVYMCHPLITRHGLIGVLSCGSRQRDRLTSQELAVIEGVANLGAVAIERARVLLAFEAERAAREASMRELEAERARWQATVMGMAEEVWACDAKGRMSVLNVGTSTAMGLEEFKDKTIDDVLQEVDILHADGRPRPPEDSPLLRSLKGEVVRGEEIMRHRRTGLTRYRQFSSAPTRDASGAITGAVAVVRDVTNNKRVEKALRDSEERLTLALTAAKGGAWVLDVDAKEVSMTGQAAEILGLPPGTRSVSRTEMLQRVVPRDRSRVEAALEKALATGLYSVEFDVLQPDSSLTALASFGQFQADNRRLVGIVIDVTEHKAIEEALREAHQRKDEFIATLSHELRNPLAPIRYALRLVEEGALTEQATRALGVISRQVNHLVRLVDDLLDVSRIAHGEIELRRRQLRLRSVLTNAVEAISPLVLAARHTLDVVVDDGDIWVDGDLDRLAQVVVNILTNAAKYTPRGGRISLEGFRDGAQAVVRVRDNGVGISKASLPKVFDMFWQSHEREMGHTGLGIGLALSKRLVQLHGGSIEAHSEGPGQGAEFIVRLPTCDGIDASVSGRPEPEQVKGKRLKVLIVDDNADLVEMLATAVLTLGHDVRKALDGRSAVGAAVAYRPDVVLLDLGLPLMDGCEVARELRRRPETARSRLVAMTGWGQVEVRRRTREAGFDMHLTKPTDPDVLVRLLSELATEPDA